MGAIRARQALRLATAPLLAGLVAAAVGFLVSARQPAVYRATATLAAAPSTRLTDGGDILRALDTLERRSVLATFARLPATEKVRSSIARDLGLDAGELRDYRIRGSVLPHVHVIQIEVLGPDPDRALDLIEAAASSTRRRARELYSVFSLRLLDPPRVSRTPVAPVAGRDAAIAGLLGVFLGTILVAAWRAWARQPTEAPGVAPAELGGVGEHRSD